MGWDRYTYLKKMQVTPYVSRELTLSLRGGGTFPVFLD